MTTPEILVWSAVAGLAIWGLAGILVLLLRDRRALRADVHRLEQLEQTVGGMADAARLDVRQAMTDWASANRPFALARLILLAQGATVLGHPLDATAYSLAIAREDGQWRSRGELFRRGASALSILFAGVYLLVMSGALPFLAGWWQYQYRELTAISLVAAGFFLGTLLDWIGTVALAGERGRYVAALEAFLIGRVVPAFWTTRIAGTGELSAEAVEHLLVSVRSAADRLGELSRRVDQMIEDNLQDRGRIRQLSAFATLVEELNRRIAELPPAVAAMSGSAEALRSTSLQLADAVTASADRFDQMNDAFLAEIKTAQADLLVPLRDSVMEQMNSEKVAFMEVRSALATALHEMRALVGIIQGIPDSFNRLSEWLDTKRLAFDSIEASLAHASKTLEVVAKALRPAAGTSLRDHRSD